MVVYICEGCGKECDHKGNLLSHLSKKKSCTDDPKPFVYIQESNEYFCKYCYCLVGTLQGIYKHTKSYCEHRPDSLKIESKKKELEKLKLESMVIEKELVEIENNSVNQLGDNNANHSYNTINNTTNNTTNINQPVFFVNFGNENVNKLSRDDRKEILSSCMLSLLKCVEKVHCNPKIPEQNNVYISNHKLKKFWKYTNGKFCVTNSAILLDELINNRANDIRYMIQNRGDIKIPEKTITRINDLLDSLDNGHEERIENIKDEIHYILYNNRHMAIDREKELKKK
jgi:hypothetical protein